MISATSTTDKSSQMTCERAGNSGVIVNGRIIDGTGSPLYSGKVEIRAGRIAAIGNLQSAPRGKTIDHATHTLDSGLSSWAWTPALTDLGWYRATLELRAGQRRVGATRVDFAWVDAPVESGQRHGPPTRDAARFGILLSELPAAQRSLVPDIIRLTGAGAVSIPVWTSNLRADQVPALAQGLVPVSDRQLAGHGRSGPHDHSGPCHYSDRRGRIARNPRHRRSPSG